ncbi:MAG: hypothetical protein GXX10_11360 [Clostridiaceae bacterium]|nr:hypothetical protein [Clostridiaceae bacterium]
MDYALRFLILAAVTYLTFLCTVRLAMGTQYKAKSFSINIIGMIAVYGSFIILRYGELLKLPEYLCYAFPIILVAVLPPLALKMKSDQTIKYLVLAVLFLVLLHLCLSFFVGWRDILPFIKIPSLWDFI